MVRLWYLHKMDRLSIFVGPPRAQGVMWWTSQLSAACLQSGTGQVVSVARARSRCLALANRFVLYRFTGPACGWNKATSKSFE